MTTPLRRLTVAVAAALWTLALPTAGRAGELPIFDAHMHYSAGARLAFQPAQVLAKMKAAGVTGALVSSTPDDGTLALLDAAPGRFVGGFRPYKDSADLGGWYKNPDLLAYARTRLAQGRHKVFGEVHLHAPRLVDEPVLAGYVALARERGLYFHIHSDAAVVEALLAKWPDLRIIWAHAGMSDDATTIRRTLDRHANVWAELSYRARDIIPGTDIEPEWRDLLVRHADRFMIATDTWETDRWAEYEGLIGEHRAWLAELPPDIAARIANGNAKRLLGGP